MQIYCTFMRGQSWTVGRHGLVEHIQIIMLLFYSMCRSMFLMFLMFLMYARGQSGEGGPIARKPPKGFHVLVVVIVVWPRSASTVYCFVHWWFPYDHFGCVTAFMCTVVALLCSILYTARARSSEAAMQSAPKQYLETDSHCDNNLQ